MLNRNWENSFLKTVPIHSRECYRELLGEVVVAGLERSKACVDLLVAI